MKSEQTPWTHTGITSVEISMDFQVSKMVYPVIIPAGTACRKLDGGSAPWVVADLDFIANKDSLLYSDADTYGICIPEEKIENISPVARASVRMG